ncbi:hypothetical protein JTB14_027187 [Gonioctena quinquepunctata]|nr:hypothetical protein JTB14_027187 [Gonioctena quinquepunctata]
MQRRLFLEKLSFQLLEEHLQLRANNVNVPKQIRERTKEILKIEDPEPDHAVERENKRWSCTECNKHTVGNLVNTIQTLNQENQLRNPVLLQDLINKLPMRLRMERVEKDLLQSDLKLVKFQEWLENLADDVCQLQNLSLQIQNMSRNKLKEIATYILSNTHGSAILVKNNITDFSAEPIASAVAGLEIPKLELPSVSPLSI